MSSCIHCQVTWALLNWAAPCLLKKEVMESRGNALTMLCHMSARNLGTVIMPQFTYNKGQLHLTEDMCKGLLLSRGLNVENKFALTYKDKTDARDQRPLMYDGRIAVGDWAKSKEFWGKSKL